MVCRPIWHTGQHSLSVKVINQQKMSNNTHHRLLKVEIISQTKISKQNLCNQTSLFDLSPPLLQLKELAN